MPYIDQSLRNEVDPLINNLIQAINGLESGKEKAERYLSHAGILNYCVTRLLLGVIPERKYWVIALKSGVIDNIATEFYRKYAVPYEEEKINSNGDVY